MYRWIVRLTSINSGLDWPNCWSNGWSNCGLEWISSRSLWNCGLLLRKERLFWPAGAVLAGLAALAAASNKLIGWFPAGAAAAAVSWAGWAAPWAGAGAWAAGCGGGFCGNKCSGIPYFFQI